MGETKINCAGWTVTQERDINVIQERQVNAGQERPINANQEKQVNATQERHITATQERDINASQERHITATQERQINASQERHITATQEIQINATQERHITATTQERDINAGHERHINMEMNRCGALKLNTVRYFTVGSRYLVLRFVLLSLGAAALLGYAVLTSYNNDNRDDGSPLQTKHRHKRQSGTCNIDMCLTQECVHAASSILQFMDTSVDPCEDFYEYTCGGWIRENEHRTGLDDLFYAVNHNSLPEKIDLILGQLLKQNLPIPEDALDSKPYQNLFTFYESCLFVSHLPESNAEAIELLKSLQEFQIGRPFDRNSWNLTKAVLEMMRINGAPLLDVVIQSDIMKPEKYSIHITPPRRYGLIPALLGPSLRRPGVEEYFRLKSRRALFGDLSDDTIMRELLSALDAGSHAYVKAAANEAFVGTGTDTGTDTRTGKGTSTNWGGVEERGPTFRRRTGSVSNLVGKPSLNILPTDDILEKTTMATSDLQPTTTTTTTTTTPPETTTVSLGTSSTPDSASTTYIVKKAATTSTSSPPTVRSTTSATSFSTTSSDSSQPITTAHPPPPTSSSSSSFSSSSSSPPPPSPSSFSSSSPSPPTTFYPTESSEMPFKPDESTEFPDYEGDEAYSENYKKIVSRKAVFKLFQRNLDKKRTEAIGDMVQNSFHNMTDENVSEAFGDFQPEDIYSAVIDHFVPLLNEIQPTEQEELQAQQHALLYNQFTVQQLQNLVPMIEWHYLLSELFGKNITDEDNIYVYHPGYMTQLNHLLEALDPWIVHYGLVALYAYDVLREAAIAPPEMDREDFCLQATKNVFGDVMSHMYLHHVGNKTIHDLQKHASSMLELLQEEVRNSLTWATWLNPSDKQVALNKLNGLQAEVGAFERHWDINYVNESHEGISLSTDDSFLSNVMVIYRTFRKELYKVYNEPINREELIWSFTVQPFIVNAFHMQTTNTIVFPEAFFQKPYYSAKAPEYINYGSAGTAMAHEMFHGLDFTGTLFDHHGAMTRPFSNDSRYHLREIVECYHKLLSDTFYEEVPVEDTLISMEIDSSTTLNENLADIGGIRHAFRAYQRWEAQNYREPRLPAISLNSYQLFFVAAVRPYCAVIPNLAKIFLMEMDEHLPNGMRMNAMLMNTPEFAQVFNCSPGSGMVANQTCPIFR